MSPLQSHAEKDRTHILLMVPHDEHKILHGNKKTVCKLVGKLTEMGNIILAVSTPAAILILQFR